jgi:hypothetical protein
MFGRRATVGLTLLCALLFSAIAVQSASAAAAKNTTFFTCVKTDSGKSTFTDPHCDFDDAGKGNFEHQPLESGLGNTTEVESSNETTGGTTSPQVLEGSPFKVSTSISCTTLAGIGSVGNTEPKLGEHKISAKTVINLSGCTVAKPAKCAVNEPIVMTFGSIEGLEGLTGPKGEANAMGVEYKSEAGRPITTITLEGAECALKGFPFPVEGSIIETSGPGTAEAQTKIWHGATSIFTAAMSNLTAAGRPATYTGNKTVVMKKVAGKTSWPITKTTVT